MERPSKSFVKETKDRLEGCTVEHVEGHAEGGVVLHLSNREGPAGWVRFSAGSYQDVPVLALGWPVEHSEHIHEAL